MTGMVKERNLSGNNARMSCHSIAQGYRDSFHGFQYPADLRGKECPSVGWQEGVWSITGFPPPCPSSSTVGLLFPTWDSAVNSSVRFNHLGRETGDGGRGTGWGP